MNDKYFSLLINSVIRFLVTTALLSICGVSQPIIVGLLITVLLGTLLPY